MSIQKSEKSLGSHKPQKEDDEGEEIQAPLSVKKTMRMKTP